jgi:hypothetical protein
MGNVQGEYRPHDESGTADSESRGKEWDAYINKRSGNSDKKGIHPIQGNTPNTSGKVQLHGKLYKGRYQEEKLEARELSDCDIKSIEYSETSELLYDLEVEGNHNYFITKDNIISHNSGKSFIIIRQIIIRALKEPGSRHLIVRLAFNHAKQSLWHDTIPKCLELSLNF